MGYKQYCKEPEKIENYDKALKDNFKGWECHHRLETHTPEGERRDVDISHKELKALRMYYHRPAEELIFLTTREHRALRRVSDSTRKKLREINKGEKNPFYGKTHSEETRKKWSEARKGNTYAKGNKSTKGMRWFNNGKINKVCYECPDGFVPGRLK